MKYFPNFMLTSFISLLICFILFSLSALSLFMPERTTDKAVQKAESSIVYTAPEISENTTVLLNISECAVIFTIKFAPKKHNISVGCTPKFSVNKNKEKSKNIENKESATNFTKEKHDKIITFDLLAFEDTVNYLGGIEIETPYGLPYPSKNNETLKTNERICVYGASLGTILTQTNYPSEERLAYYCYIIGELCLKYLKSCSTESYSFLNKNAQTDISYTDFYDNYQSYKNSIKYAVCNPPEGDWESGWFYMQ